MCKIFMQKLWMSKVSWDERVKGELFDDWLTILSHLPNINCINIPRLIKPVGIPEVVYLHVFADSVRLLMVQLHIWSLSLSLIQLLI